jgi:hypothetical protein
VQLFRLMATPLEQSIKNLMLEAQQARFDPAIFGDSLAKRVEWTPLALGGSSFTTHRLKKLSDDRVEFRRAFALILVALVVMLPGLGVFTLGVLTLVGIPYVNASSHWPPILAGAIFTATGLFVLRSARTVVFDRQCGWFYTGKKPTGPEAPGAGLLSTIHALQILSKSCTQSKGSSFRSYELNLVLKDGTRINVIDHGSISKLIEDADQLGQFLGVPVWDGTWS